VAQIFLATPPGAAAVGTAGAPAAATSGVRVDANQAWVDTGINVSRGDGVAFNASGDIMVAPGASAGVGGTPALTSPQYPVPSAMAGALIGKVGNSAPFLIGSNTQPITMPADGGLMLGINDDGFGDNTGSFSVTIIPTTQTRRGLFRR
jgi:PA-IL-like protein